MSRPTQISDRQKIKAFFRDVLRGEAGVGAAQTETLAEKCARRVKRMVVWDHEPAPAPIATEATPAVARPATAGPLPAAPSTAETSPPAATPTPAKKPASAVERAPAATPIGEQAPAPDTAPPFDPYAFSAVVVLTKTGKDGLLKRLSAIERSEHLKKLADAQHLAIDRSLDSLDALRHAILKAAEQRIADRRAAAS